MTTEDLTGPVEPKIPRIDERGDLIGCGLLAITSRYRKCSHVKVLIHMSQEHCVTEFYDRFCQKAKPTIEIIA